MLAERGGRSDAFVVASGSVIASDQRIDGVYPEFIERAKGAYIWDTDGRRFLDYLCGYGTILLGHADDEVDRAVIAEIGRGFATGHPKELQVRLNERLVQLIPCAELSMLLKTGSDATSAAIRLARAFTGRERVARFGYNGWHDWAAQRRAGIPASTDDLVTVFPYNDFYSLETELRARADEYAAVLMMPFEVEQPNSGYLEAVRALTQELGIVLVFDEMRSGFRLAMGGAQEVMGVVPDLATFGKAMANGYALSAVVGRGEILERLHQVHISSTFYNNSLEMAAALATIETIERTSALTTIRERGEQLQDGLRAAIAGADVPVEVVGVPQMPFLAFPDQASTAKETFYRHVASQGYLLHPNHHWYVNASMTADEITSTVEVCADGLQLAAKKCCEAEQAQAAK